MVYKRHTGFTLMELMITLAVLAILVAISVPSMSGLLERRKVHGAGENLFGTLTFAKTEAIKRNEPIRVSFTITDANTWCYGLAVNADCDCTDNVPACEIDGEQKIVNQDDFDGVTIDIAGSTFDTVGSTDFTPLRGDATSAGNLQFTVPSGSELGVIVSNLGRIRMCSTSFGLSSCPGS